MSPRRPPQPGKRAQLRAQQRRRLLRRIQVGSAGALVLLCVILLVLLTGGGGSSGGKAKGPSRTQHTLLLQVQQPDRTSISGALLAHDSKTKLGSVVLVPPQVLAQVPGVGNVPFGHALALGDQAGAVVGARNALSDLLAVTVDGSWVLDVATFERLIDQLGGVHVTVDVPVLRGRTVLLSPGAQLLDGRSAEAFATFLGSGEQEQSRLARLQAVLDGIISSLPGDARKVSALVRSLGPGSQTSVPVAALSDLLLGLEKDDSANDLQYRSLPVIPVASGDETLFRIDAAAAQSMVGELLAQSVPPGVRETGNRVLVLNGVGTPGLGALVRAKLVPAGFVFVGSRNAPRFGYATTQILVKDATPAGAALGARVARALGVPDSSVAASDQIGTIADVVVIIGADFKHK